MLLSSKNVLCALQKNQTRTNILGIDVVQTRLILSIASKSTRTQLRMLRSMEKEKQE